MANKWFLVTFLFVYFLPFLSAVMLINLNSNLGNNPSLVLNHGQSQQISFTASNSNSICSVSCTWALLSGTNTQLSSGSQTASAGASFSIPITFTAPTKHMVKQDSGTEQYTLGVTCQTITGLTCWTGDTSPPATITITLNYDLTSEEKSAKSYMQTQLATISSLLKDDEGIIYNINSKLSQLPKNVLINDLKNQLTSYNSNYQSYKNGYDSANSLYSNLNYIEAKNSFDSSLLDSSNQLKGNLDTLGTAIDDRIKLHNEVTDQLNKLKESSAQLIVKAKLFNKDVLSLSSQVDSLTNSFESGSFTSYTDFQNIIPTLSNQISSESSSFDRSMTEIISKGNNVISSESSKINGSNQYSVASSNDIAGIKTLCSQLSSIASSFQNENSKRTQDHDSLLAEIDNYNNNLDTINPKIDALNQLRNQISQMVNKDNLKEVDYSICQYELSSISEFNYAQLNSPASWNYSSCSNLNKNLSELRAKKESSFIFKLMRFFRVLWPFDSVQFAQIQNLEKKEIPNSPELLDFAIDSQKFNSDYCSLNLNSSVQKTTYVSNVAGAQLTSSNVGGIIEHEDQCCSFDVCSKCCEDNECANDEDSYPVIFLHGHSFSASDSPEYSLDAFTNLQLALYNGKFRIGGIFRPSDQYSGMVQGEWGKVKFPITVKATYYYNVYNTEGKIINAPSGQESIDTYAQRLKTVVDLVKYRTGRNKVNIVAHSMGGLVARDYIKNYGGDDSVDKLIMIGTPNHGVNGQVDSFCAVLGANTECAQMEANSSFITNLNSGSEIYGSVKYYTIAGSGCILSSIDGDGISRVQSVQLAGATNVLVLGKCESPLNRGFHSNLLDPNKYSQTYNYVKQFLQE